MARKTANSAAAAAATATSAVAAHTTNDGQALVPTESPPGHGPVTPNPFEDDTSRGLPPTPSTPQAKRTFTQRSSGAADSPPPASPSPTKRVREDVAAINLGVDAAPKIPALAFGTKSGPASDDPFAQKSGSASDDPFALLKKKAPKKIDSRSIFVEPSALLDVDPLPDYINDVTLYSKRPGFSPYFIPQGEIVSWSKAGPHDDIIYFMGMSAYERYIDDPLVLDNIMDGLTMRSDGSFYNAATANPVNYIGKAFATNYGLQFDVALPDGKLAIGITVAACASCDLNGDPTTVEGNEYFSISCIPHRGIWERMQSFHALMSGASEIQGQVVKNILSFQTRAASFSNSRSYGSKASKSSLGNDTSFLEGYQSPSKPKVSLTKRSLTEYRLSAPYRCEETVPILDGRSVEITYTSTGLKHLLATLPTFDGDITERSPCVIGYTANTFTWQGDKRIKFHVAFVIVLAIA